MKKFIRAYTGYFFGLLSYQILLYTLSKLCDQVDEIISTDTSKNVLLDGTKDTVTSHDYNIGKEIVNITKTRGGQSIVIRGEGAVDLIRKAGSNIKIFGGKTISIAIKPISKALGYIIIKFPPVKKVLDVIKTTKVIIASIGSLISLRLIARFDYWALIFSDSLPQLPIDAKVIISGIRRLRIGHENMTVCIAQSNEIVNLVMNEEIQVEKKQKALVNLFSMYGSLPEDHLFKNPYFTCIVHLLLTLSIADTLGFKLALRLLYRLLNNGKISLETYREIISQLVIGGVPTTDIDFL